MPGKINFFYAIYRRLQASAGGMSIQDAEHFNVDNSDDLGGGFSLRETSGPHGLFGSLSAAAPNFGIGLQQGWMPLNPNSNVPIENPLYAMLAKSLDPDGTVPDSVTVAGQVWPVMPPPFQGSISNHTEWLAFNAGSPKLIDAFGQWIKDGKVDDSPKDAPLTYAALRALPKPAAFPLHIKPPNQESLPILFVASMAGDDGRRHGDHAMPDVPLDHVPPHFWATSQIFLCDETGAIVHPATLEAGQELSVVAMIGNSGNMPAGRLFDTNQPKTLLLGAALAFNTFMSPGTYLPSLANLDPAQLSSQYEHYGIRSLGYDTAAWRFNVDKVFAGLKTSLVNAGVDLGGATPEEWLKNGHPCVKIWITEGEPVNMYQPGGGEPAATTINSKPRLDRHIAQRNLAPFDMKVMAAKKIDWKNFIVSQAGEGTNTLTLQHALPAGSVRFYLAVPKKTFERHASKGLRGWSAVDKVVNKPFPDAVLLQATGSGASVQVAAHGSEPFLGMSLGIEGDPSTFKTVRSSDVAMVHADHNGTVIGGFTVRVRS
jgi:hypothetical protein